MLFKDMKMYYKAAVMVPFFAACFMLFPAIALGSSLLTEVAFLSGLTGICSLTMFLNCNRRIAMHALYSTLSFFLLPCCFLSYMIYSKVIWKYHEEDEGAMFYNSLIYVISFLHILGLCISFIDFRRSIKKQKQLLYKHADKLPTMTVDN